MTAISGRSEGKGAGGMKKREFLLNALVMAASSLILRTANIAYRVYITDKVGAAGMGLYQLISSVFLLAVTVCTSGISLAVTRLVAEAAGSGRPSRGRNAVLKCVLWSGTLSLVSGSALWMGADFIAAELLGSEAAAAPLRILVPGLPFMAVSSCMRGYFVALRSAVKASAGEFLEQFSTMGTVAAIFLYFAPSGLENACCAIMLGATAGEILSCLFNLALYLHSVRKNRVPSGTEKTSFRSVAHIALPSMAGYTARNILSTIENVLIPRGLKKNGASADASLAQYGMIHGMVMPMLYFPSAFLSAFSSLLVPEVAEACAAGYKRSIERLTCRSIQLTLLFSFFVMSVFWAFSGELGLAFYKNSDAGNILRILCPLVPLMYLDSIVDSILKGLDQQVSSLKYNFSDSCIRVALVYFLVPQFGVKGYLCVLFFSTIFNATLSIHRLIVVSRVEIRVLDWIVKPLVSAALAVSLVILLENLIPGIFAFGTWGTAAAHVGVSLILYCSFLWMTGAFTKPDLQWLVGIFRAVPRTESPSYRKPLESRR